VTTTAPDDGLLLCVALVKVVAPLAVNEVNAPVEGVELPIGLLLTLPPVITALPELKLVATNVVARPDVMLAVVVLTTAEVVVPASSVVMLAVVLFKTAVVVVPAPNVVMLPVVLFNSCM
jgi:hypothetical protein